MSLPSRERGLKQIFQHSAMNPACVAPLAGAWIETASERSMLALVMVAPLAGAWIETLQFK